MASLARNPEGPGSDPPVARLRERWIARYGPVLGVQLEADRYYSLVRVGAEEYAVTSYERYVAALKHTWSEGLVAEPRPGVVGSELLEAARPAGCRPGSGQPSRGIPNEPIRVLVAGPLLRRLPRLQRERCEERQMANESRAAPLR